MAAFTFVEISLCLLFDSIFLQSLDSAGEDSDTFGALGVAATPAPAVAHAPLSARALSPSSSGGGSSRRAASRCSAVDRPTSG